jgi:hypothetical protein
VKNWCGLERPPYATDDADIARPVVLRVANARIVV